MNNKEAIKIAKDYIQDVFEDEGIKNLGLEEIQRDDNAWEITIGFTRSWQRGNENSPVAATLGKLRPDRRSFKVVRIDETKKEVISMEEPTWVQH